MLRYLLALSFASGALAPTLAGGQASAPTVCRAWDASALQRNPTAVELRCRYGALGPGRFGLLSYVDVPVYQPATPMPGTHVVGVPGHAGPGPGESYEEWEWRVLRTRYGPEAQRVHRELELLDPFVAARVVRLEQRLAQVGIRAVRRETWRAPERQAFIFQQGRSRPGPVATATLTSWHSQVDAEGRPAGRAVDYEVPAAQLARFHEIVREVGLHGFGADSFDPGHVFLPLQDELPQHEIILLRVLPRVPEVTLSTGLPVDRPLPPGGRAALREEAREFVSLPFLPYPLPAVAIAARGPEPVLEARIPGPRADVGCRLTRRAWWARGRSGGGDAPCARRRSAVLERREGTRNTGG